MNELYSYEKIVLKAIYKACKGSTHANVSIAYIMKKIPKNVSMLINLKKTLRKLEKKGLIWRHAGRRANGGVTYGITKEGAKLARRLIEEE